MTWGSGTCLPTGPTAAQSRARRQALGTAKWWHCAAISAAALAMVTGSAFWWLAFLGMTYLTAIWLDCYQRIVAVHAGAYGGGHAH